GFRGVLPYGERWAMYGSRLHYRTDTETWHACIDHSTLGALGRILVCEGREDLNDAIDLMFADAGIELVHLPTPLYPDVIRAVDHDLVDLAISQVLCNRRKRGSNECQWVEGVVHARDGAA